MKCILPRSWLSWVREKWKWRETANCMKLFKLVYKPLGFSGGLCIVLFFRNTVYLAFQHFYWLLYNFIALGCYSPIHLQVTNSSKKAKCCLWSYTWWNEILPFNYQILWELEKMFTFRHSKTLPMFLSLSQDKLNIFNVTCIDMRVGLFSSNFW